MADKSGIYDILKRPKMMKTNIKATNITLTPAIEEYISKKVAAFDKFVHEDDTSARVSVEVGKETEHHRSGDVFFAEFNMHVAGKNFYARRDMSDVYAAIDIVKDELLDALRAHKDKQITLFRRGAQAVKDMIRGFNFRRKR